MTFKLNGIDIGDDIEVAGYTLVPRKVFGPSAGYLTTGEHIADMIAYKRDFKINIVATEQTTTSQISSACSAEYCEVELNDPVSNTYINSNFEPSIDKLQMAIETTAQGKIYWYGFTITFTEK